MDRLNRRSRLGPTSTGKRVSPTERDLLWLRKLAQHGPLPSSFLLAFSRDTHHSEKRARERLTDLFHEANTPDGGPYLIRPPQQFRTIDSRYNQLVYDLAPAGWRALARSKLADGKQPAPSGPWLHRFMTSSITASVELCTLARDSLTYISQSEILARVESEIGFPVTITDPETKRSMVREIIPDAVFGLRYHTTRGDRFRFFSVEADRATEPTTTANWNRKSFLRNVLQYEAYVAGGGYREHLGLAAPMLVLNVTSDPTRMKRMLRLMAGHFPQGNNYQLFQCWEDFGPVFRPSSPNFSLLAGAWTRAALPPIQIEQQ